MTSMLLVSSCALGINSNAICDGTIRYRDAHADTLLVSPDDRAVITGAALIAALDAACG